MVPVAPNNNTFTLVFRGASLGKTDVKVFGGTGADSLYRLRHVSTVSFVVDQGIAWTGT